LLAGGVGLITAAPHGHRGQGNGRRSDGTSLNKKATMKKSLVAILLTSALALSAFAAVLYNQNITAIFGSGNPNTGWATDTTNGLVLGLRAKSRSTGSTANASGVYTFPLVKTGRGA
jgi:hypothetical protein